MNLNSSMLKENLVFHFRTDLKTFEKKPNIWTESLRESQRARHTSLLSEQTAIFPQWNKVNTKSSAESSAKAPPPEIILEQIDPKVACQALRLRSQESVEMKKNKCKKKRGGRGEKNGEEIGGR